ncbi:MAG: hypothetical protein P8Y18_01900 [Candidatus Bathyarchaeota archaeon]
MEKKGLLIVIIGVLAINIALFAVTAPILLNLLFRPEISPMMPPQTTKINSINWDENTNQIRVIAEYTGNKTVTLKEVYVNEILDNNAIIANRVLAQNQKTEIILSETYVTKPNKIAIRIATSNGIADFYETKIFYEIAIKQIDWNEKTGKIGIVVRNNGDEPVTLTEINVNGIPDAFVLPSPKILETKQEIEMTLSETFTDTHTPIEIRVLTLEGVSAERSDPI